MSKFKSGNKSNTFKTSYHLQLTISPHSLLHCPQTRLAIAKSVTIPSSFSSNFIFPFNVKTNSSIELHVNNVPRALFIQIVGWWCAIEGMLKKVDESEKSVCLLMGRIEGQSIVFDSRSGVFIIAIGSGGNSKKTSKRKQRCRLCLGDKANIEEENAMGSKAMSENKNGKKWLMSRFERI